MHVLNREKASTSRQKTVVVLGLGRGGTSMVAGVLDRVGVYMGETDDVVHEDREMLAIHKRAISQHARLPRIAGRTVQDIRRALTRRLRHLFRYLTLRSLLTPEQARAELLERLNDTPVDLDSFDRLVASRNAAHELWGWKIPGLLVPRLFERVRNPYLIAVFRDPAAIAERRVASEGVPFVEAFTEVGEIIKTRIDAIAAMEHPCLVLSYEKALRNREACVDSIIDFLGIEVDAARRQAAVESIESSPSRYIAQSRYIRIIGSFDGLNGALVRGWARDKERPAARLEVELFVDGELSGQARADKLREDLKLAKQGDGRHGFELALPDDLLDGRGHLVEVRIAGAQAEAVKLDNNPRRLRLPTGGRRPRR